MASDRLEGLDVLRGIAAACVLLHHAFKVPPGSAFLAVDLFFMLSGYVMARTYEGRLGAGLGAARFFQLRLKRLWPTMLAAGLLATPVFLWNFGMGAWPIVIANLLLIPWPAMDRVYPLNSPAWSIFFELFANAIHGLVLHRVPTRGLVALTLAALVWFAVHAAQAGTTGFGPTPETFAGGFPRVAFSYLIGIILFRRWRDEPSIPIGPMFAFLAMPAYFGLTAALQGSFWLADLAFVAIVCPLVMAGGLRASRCGALARWAGAVSFPLYAFHVPIFRAFDAAGLSRLWGIPLSVAVAAVAVWATTAGSRWLGERKAAREPQEGLPVPAR